uniref:Ig-like domain-containing protein n=1 Tax=Erpetoichthys calabaricus TaxID=27687 RepID=A0A8C4X6B8_ERPCA
IKDNVWQTPNTVEVIQGQHVKLECYFETTRSAPELFWYIPYLKDSPQFDAPLDTTQKTVHLVISACRLSDSVVYFCALQPMTLKRILGLISYKGRYWQMAEKLPGLLFCLSCADFL